MTGTATADRRPGPLALVWLFGVTQIVGYGTVYYSFAILAGSVAADFGWPVAWIFGAFSLALVLGGLVAPAVGRAIDRHGAPTVMAIGSFAMALLLAATAMAPGPLAFVAGLCAVEVASSLVLYDAAFAALVQLCGPAARLRITHLTLVAGFASSLFWPFTTWLHGHLDWRSVFLVFAAMNLLVCFPIHLWIAGGRRRSQGGAGPSGEAPPVAGSVPPERVGRVLALVAIGFAVSGFMLSALLTQMVPALLAVGLGDEALLVSVLFGPSQVLVRFVNMVAGSRRHPLTVTLVSAGLLPLAVAILAVTAPNALGAAVFAVLLGFGSGLKSIVQGTLPLALFGSAGYGARLGRLASVRLFMGAVAPFAFALALEGAGPAVSLALLIVAGLAGVGAFVIVGRLIRLQG